MFSLFQSFRGDGPLAWALVRSAGAKSITLCDWYSDSISDQNGLTKCADCTRAAAASPELETTAIRRGWKL